MLYSKEGRALRLNGDDLISRVGHVARLRDAYAFAPDGRYVGTDAAGGFAGEIEVQYYGICGPVAPLRQVIG